MDAAKLTGTYPALDASAVTGLTAANLTGTFGALNASAVTGLTSANLTGTLPAISGAALTGVPSGFPDTTSASDPATNTNPAGGVGTVWVNTTSGETYACTDATTDNNVWTNVGGGTGDVVPYSFQGSNYGYTYGGASNAGATEHNDIQQYSFNSDGAGTDIGSLNTTRHAYTAASSVTHGYCIGGWTGT